MKNLARTLAVILSLAGCGVFSEERRPLPNEWRLNVEQWKLEPRLKGTSFARNEGIDLEIRLTNISKSDGLLFCGTFPLRDFSIVVSDSAGRQIPPTAEGDKTLVRKPAIGKLGLFVTIPPSQSDVHEIDLAKLFHLSNPGKYTVTVARYEAFWETPPPFKVVGSASFVIK